LPARPEIVAQIAGATSALHSGAGKSTTRQIGHVLVRCGERGGPTLAIHGCRRVFDNVPASDLYGLLAELGSPDSQTRRTESRRSSNEKAQTRAGDRD
jgi:hypothetical protein